MRIVIQEIGKRFCAFIFALTVGFMIYSLVPLHVLPLNNDYSETKYVPSIHFVEVFKCDPKPLETIKPNPYVLFLEIDEGRNLSLNRERFGSLDQTSELKSVLSRIFDERAQNGVYKKDTFEVEKTVIIRPAASIKFTEVIKVIEVLEETGATIIQSDSEYCNSGGDA